jgi:hypothetical protein
MDKFLEKINDTNYLLLNYSVLYKLWVKDYCVNLMINVGWTIENIVILDKLRVRVYNMF